MSRYRQAEPRASLSNPSPVPIWWTFEHEEKETVQKSPGVYLTYVRKSTCHVFTRLWVDAREIARAELGTCEPTLIHEAYDKRKADLA